MIFFCSAISHGFRGDIVNTKNGSFCGLLSGETCVVQK